MSESSDPSVGGEIPEVAGDAEIRDELPEELNAAGYVGPYRFPDNSRRRIPAVMYLVIAVGCFALWATASDGAVLINDGFLWVAIALAAVAVYSFTSGWRLGLDEKEALVAATTAVGFPVGHASAQLAWRGLRARPTWRILAYSTEEPPTRRAFVLVDAIDGTIVSQFAETNPEDWSERV